MRLRGRDAQPLALSILSPAPRTRLMPPSVPTDEDLVAATLEGDDEAFTELVRRHKRRVFTSAARFARDDQQLDDICQEVFLRVFRHLEKFRRAAPFEHWLARITVSACYDFLRKERRVRALVPLDSVEYEMKDTTVASAVSAGEARELVDFALRKLPADERLILTLCEIEERSVREVAQLTGWTESNVKVRAFRARQNLKHILELSDET